MKKPSRPLKKAPAEPDKASWSLSSPFFFIPVAALLTWMVYSACTGFDITNWDDNHYIRELLLIRSLDWDNIVRMFTTKVLLSYNPLSILSLAIDYKLGENSPSWYHGMNVFLHIADTLLLYAVLRKLFKQDLLPAVVSLLFALHPMHVEAVAWIACRKDVLYVFFFLLAWWAYLAYIDFQSESRSKRFLWYGLSLIFFAASGFSKVQAVTFPLILVITDQLRSSQNTRLPSNDFKWESRHWRLIYYVVAFILFLLAGFSKIQSIIFFLFLSALIIKDNVRAEKISWRSVFEKLPFFLGALCFGGYAVFSSSLAADQYAEPVTFFQRIVYSFQAFSIYVFKSLVPVYQSAIRPFPAAGSSEYYILLVSGVLLSAVFIWAVFRYRHSNPIFVSGLVFFLVNIFPTLHVVGLNSSLIYERFTYLSYIGLFIALADFPVSKTLSLNRRLLALSLLWIPFAFLSYQRTLVWKSSLTLWNDVLEKHPGSHEARNNRGAYYNERGEVDQAMADFNVSLQVNPRQPRTFNNRSMIWFKKQDYKRSLQDVDSALALEPRLAEAWCNKGNAYFGMQSYDTAIVNYTRAAEIMPNFPSVYSNRGSAYLKKGDYVKALEDYSISVRQDPSYADGWRLMALACAELGKDDSAMIAAQRANSLNPGSNAFVNLSEEYVAMGIRYWYPSSGSIKRQLSEIEPAIDLFEKALSVNPSNANALEELGGMWYTKQDIPKARDYWKKALAVDPKLERSRQGLASTGGF